MTWSVSDLRCSNDMAAESAPFSSHATLPFSKRGEWNVSRRMAKALDLLKDRTLVVLITGESAFDALPDLMPRLTTSPGNTLCHRIRYD